MTGSDVQGFVEMLLGRTVDDNLIITAINDSMQEMGDMNMYYGTIDVNDVTNEDQEYSLPDDFTMIELIKKLEDDKEYIFEDYEYRNGIVTFNAEGDFTIIARRIPDEISVLGDTITGLHKLYNMAVKWYALYYTRLSEDMDDQTAQRLYNQFKEKVIRAKRTLIGTKEIAQFDVIRHG